MATQIDETIKMGSIHKSLCAYLFRYPSLIPLYRYTSSGRRLCMGVCQIERPGELDPYSSFVIEDYTATPQLFDFDQWHSSNLDPNYKRSFESVLISANSTNYGARARLKQVLATSDFLINSLEFEWTIAP